MPRLSPCLVFLLTVIGLSANIASAAISDEVKFSLGRTDPALIRTLHPGEAFYIEIHYDSPVPLRFQARGVRGGAEMTKGAAMNPAPLYPAGSGSALAWVSYRGATILDGVRVTAYDTGWSPVAHLFVHAPSVWSTAVSQPRRTPASWASSMSAAQQALVTEAIRTSGGDDNAAVGWVISAVFFLVLPGYFALQWWLPRRMSGGWRVAALAPLVGAVPLMIYTGMALAAGSNLWPLAFIFSLPLAFAWLCLVWGLSPRQPRL